MNSRQKEVIQSQLDAEKTVLKELEQQYQAALDDISLKIRILQTDDMTQSQIYRLEYQKALKKQVEATLEKLHSDEYTTIKQFLSDSYTSGYVGTMYDLHGQGMPIITAIDKNAAAKAIVSDTKLSESLYDSLGLDIKDMRKSISAEITRGIAGGMTHTEIARNINFYAGAPLSRAKTIARTESHRIQQASTFDAQKAAKDKGADVVKQWDSTLDGATRPVHRHLDGQIREIEEPFEYGGKKAMFPGDFGDPAEDCNCRCVSLQRARKALDADELATLKDRAAYFGLDKTDSFKDFEKKFMKAAEQIQRQEKFIPAKTKQEAEDFAKQNGVKYADYSKLPIDTANAINRALLTLPDDVRPVFVGDSSTLEKYWGGKLPRSSKQYYGVTIDTFDGIHLGTGKGIDFDTNGQMVGISYSYRTADKITAAKEAAQASYQAKHNGHTWFFNVSGETTPFHEMGHVYANAKGLPKEFEYAATKWATETKCDMISKPSEAWAEAWAAYHTGANELPDYIRKFIEDAVAK